MAAAEKSQRETGRLRDNRVRRMLDCQQHRPAQVSRVGSSALVRIIIEYRVGTLHTTCFLTVCERA